MPEDEKDCLIELRDNTEKIAELERKYNHIDECFADNTVDIRNLEKRYESHEHPQVNKRIEELEKWNRQTLDNNEANAYDIKGNVERIEKLEKDNKQLFNNDQMDRLDIDGIILVNKGIKEEIEELKKYYNIEKNVVNETDFEWKVAIIDRIINSEEVLRDHYKQRIKKSDWTIKALQSPEKEKEKTMVEYVKDDLEFYKKQLKKLDGKDGDGEYKNFGAGWKWV